MFWGEARNGPLHETRFAREFVLGSKIEHRAPTIKQDKKTFFFFSKTKKVHTQKAVNLAPKAAKRILFRHLASGFIF